MIALFTDFGVHGPYTGQMKAVLHQMAPGIPAIDLFADARLGLPRRRPRAQSRDQALHLLFTQHRLERLGNNPALLGLMWPVLRHGPVPVGDHDVFDEVLQVLLELIEIGAMPRQEPLPAVLAMVLVDQRLVVVAAAVIFIFVEIVDLAERVAQRVELGLGEAVEIGALPRFAIAIGIASSVASATANSRSITLPRVTSRTVMSSGVRPLSSGGQPSSIQSAMKAMSASATRLPPHMNGGKRLPSKGGVPRNAWIRPEFALRLSPPPQQDAWLRPAQSNARQRPSLPQTRRAADPRTGLARRNRTRRRQRPPQEWPLRGL